MVSPRDRCLLINRCAIQFLYTGFRFIWCVIRSPRLNRSTRCRWNQFCLLKQLRIFLTRNWKVRPKRNKSRKTENPPTPAETRWMLSGPKRIISLAENRWLLIRKALRLNSEVELISQQLWYGAVRCLIWYRELKTHYLIEISWMNWKCAAHPWLI